MSHQSEGYAFWKEAFQSPGVVAMAILANREITYQIESAQSC
jgi:hypothetical protein